MLLAEARATASSSALDLIVDCADAFAAISTNASSHRLRVRTMATSYRLQHNCAEYTPQSGALRDLATLNLQAERPNTQPIAPRPSRSFSRSELRRSIQLAPSHAGVSHLRAFQLTSVFSRCWPRLLGFESQTGAS